MPTQQVVLTRYSEGAKVIDEPRMAARLPFFNSDASLDHRLLRIDVPTASMPDKESQFSELDAYVRYRITDPEQFLVALRDEPTAGSRIGSIVIAAIRAEVGVQYRKDIIGGEPIVLSDGTPTRAAMMQRILESANETVKSPENDFGVEIVDVRLKRVGFPLAIEQSVFARMRREREVQAQRLRAEGEEEYLTIAADVDRQVAIILAEAERDADILRGEGEAAAIDIFTEALAQEPELSRYQSSLEAYKISRGLAIY